MKNLRELIKLIVGQSMSDEIKLEIELELGRRLAVSAIAHILLYVIVLLSTTIYYDYKFTMTLIGISLVFVSFMRVLLSKYQKNFYPHKRKRWIHLFDYLLIVTSFLWGVLGAFVISKYGLISQQTVIILLSLSGICAGATTSLSPSTTRAVYFIVFTLLLPIISLFLNIEDNNLSFALVFTVYAFFLIFQTKSQSKVYLSLLSTKKISETQKKEIEEALQIAEKAVQTKARFLANMSHEIRTPMNGIIGMTNLLLSSITNPQDKEKLVVIQNCGNNLLDIINDVLDFSKLEVNKVELEKVSFSLHSTVNEVLKLLETQAKQKEVKLTYLHEEIMPNWILSDVTRFRQILTNIVGNSIKFTEKGSVSVLTKAKNIENKKWQVQVSVKDTGIGIPENVKNKLFQSFSQVDASTTRKFGGTGLGLAICKGLCEQMGGSIWVESEIGKGSTFFFTIVVEEGAVNLKETSNNPFITCDSELAHKNPLNILVTEDQRTNQLVILGFLKKFGYSADIAGNGLEAIENLNRQKYDLIFMDFHMPEMDGFETTQRIRSQFPQDGQPKIFGLTASTTEEDLKNGKSAGMDGIIGKPILVSDLEKILTETKSKRNLKISQNEDLKAKVMKFESPAVSSVKNINDIEASFDHKKFNENFEDLGDLSSEVINNFNLRSPILINEIQQAIDEQNYKKLEMSAHALKGILANFYAEPSKRLAAKLEHMGRDKTFDGNLDVIENLKKELAQLSKDLHIYQSDKNSQKIA